MGKSRLPRRLFLLLLIALLVLPVNSFATQTKQTHTSLHKNSPKTIEEKINRKLKGQFAENEFVTFLVKFKEQADTKKAAAEAAEMAKKQKKTPFETRLMKRSAVVSELRATAFGTQRNVQAFLEKQKRAGRVKTFRSYYIVNSMAVTGTKEVMEELASFPEVDKLLPDEIRKLHRADAGSTNAKTATIEWNIERVGAPAVWNLGIDGSGTVVANIDSGVEWDHPALKEKYRGYNPDDPDAPDHEFNWFDAVNGRESPYDDNGHGTHTMGTMVGSGPDGSDRIGVAPGAKWIAVKAFNASGNASDSDLLAAGEWILAPKDAEGNPHPEKAPDVVNNSWGGGAGIDEWYRPMVQNWRAADIFPEFSAGNDGPGSETVASPANFPESFATGATDINNGIASFSSRGPSPYGEIKPELVAPGAGIRSAVPGGGYAGYNGTSMAGPHVSGAIALLRQADASLSVDDMERILIETAIPLTDSQYPDSPNNGYGHGLLNVFDAISSVRTGIGEVRGHVVREGEDDEPPQYRHEAPAETYTDMDLPLRVDAQDNISILKVELQYRSDDAGDWTSVEAKRVHGDYREGTYEATVPADGIKKPKLQYKWRIVDYGGNDVMSDVYEVNVKSGITIGYFQDFESTPVGWYSFGQNDSWQWGKPSSGPGQAYSGERVYGTNLDGDYASNANMTLVTPPIELPKGNAYLQFKQWYNLEQNWDYGHVFVSTDQENWTQLSRFTDLSDGWIDGEVDLSDYAGQRIYIGFNVTTDYSVVRPGWYIDDVRLSDTPLDDPPVKQQAPQTNAKASDKKGAPIDPDAIKPGKRVNIQHPIAAKDKSYTVSPQSLPLEAKVSVLETGRSVTTHPADGSYAMRHAAGSYTLRAETYGFRSVDQRVEITSGEATEANFTLQPIPQGVVRGTVTNQATGKPIAGATLLLVEDAAIIPVTTDENGSYSITAYEGTYTLKTLAPYYYSNETKITISGDQVTEQDIALKPFIGYPNEIGYDDGTPENARSFYDAGNGWAVKMSLEEGQERAMVTAGLFRFWDTEWPVPGGTRFQVAVYDDSGEDGAPGKRIAGPFEADAARDGTWTTVDLSDKGIMVEGDFYMVFLQTDPYPNSPGLATDESSPNAGRSWQYISGTWSPTPASEGNYMIRARVEYEVPVPTITSPADGTFTNQSEVTIEGRSAPSVDIHLYNGGEEAAAVRTTDTGTFQAKLTLKKGVNVLTAAAVTDRGKTDLSEPVKVILDQEKPTLTIDDPADGLKTNREAVTVEGRAIDEHLDRVTMNGVKAVVKEDGSYSHRLALDSGENRIKVVAQDKAGNIREKEITVYAKFTPPTIEHVKPDKDVTLKAGQSVTVELRSQPELSAEFVIYLPQIRTAQSGGIPMREVSPGHYVGVWTAPKGKDKIKVNGATIEVRVTDDYGNTASKAAKGKLNIK
ncbi:bacillopeptidase F [Planifilum fimeticola]|uniref:Bacillopeptidase F n=1 Tax=Planifilum fimeticola TaxID=201975 RepID=A0A2T0LHE9_9BACL|nr:bacillopeptidase F [Planifilum fimeticola]